MSSKKSNSLLKILVVLLTCGAIAILAITFVDFTAVVDTFLGMNYQPNAELAEIIERDSFTKDGKRILYASKPELLGAETFNTKCYSGLEAENSVLGCYTNNTVYVYDIDNAELNGIKETVLAHEMLHAVWNRMGINQRRALYDDLDQIYNSHLDELQEHMSGYSPEDYYDELHSVIGTQIKGNDLTASLREHYAKYFENQSQVVSYYDAYNGKFKALEKRAGELEAEINQRRTRIESLSAQYEAESEALSADINSFNSRAENGGFADTSTFYTERNELVSRQNNLVANYESLNRYIDETNELIEEYNNSVIEAGELYDSIDSRSGRPAIELGD